MHHGPGTAVGILALIGGLVIAIPCAVIALRQERKQSLPDHLTAAASFRIPLVLTAVGVILIIEGVRWV